MRYVYLHGWSSSPSSTKAIFFREHFKNLGLSLDIPDFNQPDFFSLTLSRQLLQIKQYLSTPPVTLIGSSFGALTALWASSFYPHIERLVLLAPAFNFKQNALRILGKEEYRRWRANKVLMVYHYSYARKTALDYAFVEDLGHYPETQIQCRLPTLILHGRHDTTIPLHDARHFAAQRPWIELKELESDHTLNNVHEVLWKELSAFCML